MKTKTSRKSRKSYKPRQKKITDADRKIFTHTVAGITVRVDPLETLFHLRDFPGFDWSRDPIAADEGDSAAMARTMKAVGSAFGVDSLANGGLTMTERMELLLAFSQWCEQLKKTLAPLPTSLPTSDMSPMEPTTLESLDSTSMPSESCSDEALSSASETASP